jgi:hypothetical protein
MNRRDPPYGERERTTTRKAQLREQEDKKKKGSVKAGKNPRDAVNTPVTTPSIIVRCTPQLNIAEMWCKGVNPQTFHRIVYFFAFDANCKQTTGQVTPYRPQTTEEGMCVTQNSRHTGRPPSRNARREPENVPRMQEIPATPSCTAAFTAGDRSVGCPCGVMHGRRRACMVVTTVGAGSPRRW